MGSSKIKPILPLPKNLSVCSGQQRVKRWFETVTDLEIYSAHWDA